MNRRITAAIRMVASRTKEVQPVNNPEPEPINLRAKELFESIDTLRPQLPKTTPRFDFVSDKLAERLLEGAKNPEFPQLHHVLEPLQLSPDDRITARLDVPPADPRDGDGEISLFNGLKGYVSVRFDRNYKATQVDREKAVEGQKGAARPMEPGTLTITYERYLEDLLSVVKDDLEDGRRRWIHNLRQAQRNYFTQDPLGEWEQSSVFTFMNLYRRTFRDTDRFLVFGMPLENVEGAEKKPVMKLLTTLPITQSVADKLVRSRIPLPRGTTADYRKHYWRGLMTREMYEEHSPRITIVVEALNPAMENFEMVSSNHLDKLRDGTRLEEHFAGFFGGYEVTFFAELKKKEQPTLLIAHPNTSPVGPYFEL